MNVDENGSSLFVSNYSDSDDSELANTSLKRRKVIRGEEHQEHYSRTNDEPDDSDLYFSDWEDVPLQISETFPESFDIIIKDPKDAQLELEQILKKEKVKEILKNRQKRLSIHYLGMISYMLHASKRNRWLNDKKLLKKIRKLLPNSLMDDKVKRFKKLLKKYKQAPNDEFKSQLDVQLIYILKYLIKWFRLNYKLDSNGLRVLGYLPSKSNVDGADYFPNTAAPIPNLSCFASVIKNFKHNRDTAAQIFTALLRSLGFECRLVFSLPLLSVNKNTNLQPKLDHEKLKKNKDNDLLYPYYWSELINPINETEVILLETACFHDEDRRLLRLKRFGNPIKKDDLSNYYTDIYYPIVDQFNQISMHYVIALNNENLVLDVSSRYMRDIAYRWFSKLDLRTDSGRASLLFQSLLRYLNSNINYTCNDNLELNSLRKVALINYSIPNNYTAMKRNPNLVTLSTLRYNEVIAAKSKPVGFIKFNGKKEAIYFKSSIEAGKSEQQWKFLGRSIKPNEINNQIKTTKALLPRTLNKKRLFNQNILNNLPELNETKLYGFSQTCPYIKLAVLNGKLPRNQYGNVEIFRDSMIPDGCSWLTLSTIEQLLNDYMQGKLDISINEEIDFVTVVIGFDFRSKPGLAIPVKKGVIVLKQQEQLIKKIWFYGKMQLQKQESNKIYLSGLAGWNELLKRLRIKVRIDERYGYD